MRKLSLAALTFVLAAFPLWAESVPGKVKSVDPDKNTITVTVGDKDTTFTVDKASKMYATTGKGKKTMKSDIADGLKGIKEGQSVVLTTEKKDDKEIVNEIKVEQEMKKKKKKNKE